jgi:hypothetical protein
MPFGVHTSVFIGTQKGIRVFLALVCNIQIKKLRVWPDPLHLLIPYWTVMVSKIKLIALGISWVDRSSLVFGCPPCMVSKQLCVSRLPDIVQLSAFVACTKSKHKVALSTKRCSWVCFPQWRNVNSDASILPTWRVASFTLKVAGHRELRSANTTNICSYICQRTIAGRPLVHWPSVSAHGRYVLQSARNKAWSRQCHAGNRTSKVQRPRHMTRHLVCLAVFQFNNCCFLSDRNYYLVLYIVIGPNSYIMECERFWLFVNSSLLQRSAYDFW